MATFTAVSSTGVYSDTLFPALHGGGSTVIATEADRFSTRHDADGLIIHFINVGFTPHSGHVRRVVTTDIAFNGGTICAALEVNLLRSDLVLRERRCSRESEKDRREERRNW